MSISLISYATPGFYKSQKVLSNSAKKYGVHHVFNFNSIWLSLFRTEFKIKNSQHFQHKRGAGYWVWKPYIIDLMMKKLNTNDFLIYLDSGIIIQKPVQELLSICSQNHGIMLFTVPNLNNKEWIKRDAFIIMNCDNEKYYNSKHIVSNMVILKKNSYSVKFIKEWLRLIQNFQLVSDSKNIMGEENFMEFIEHRHCQSILTLLAAKNNLSPFRSPCQYTNHLKMKPNREHGEITYNPQLSVMKYVLEKDTDKSSPYGTIFNVHRKKISFGKRNFLLKIWIKMRMFMRAILVQIKLNTKYRKPNTKLNRFFLNE